MEIGEKLKAGVRSPITTALGMLIAALTVLDEVPDPDWSDPNLYIKVALAVALVYARDGATSSQDSRVR